MVGKALSCSDDQLVKLLRRSPKETKELRTKSSFQDFFRGITEERISVLLKIAYENEIDCDARVAKRIALLQGVLG